MRFGSALEKLHYGRKVVRSGWNGKGMFLFQIPSGWEFTCDIEGVEDLQTEPFICMKTAQNTLIPWLASQADLLASDWVVIESDGEVSK